MWQIHLSKEADKFIKKEKIEDGELFELIKKVLNYAKGYEENINIKKMKGKWKEYYRIRIGKIRVILKIDFKSKIIFVDRIDYRGNVYK